MNNFLYKEHSPFEGNAHLWNTGGEHSAKLFTEAEEQGAARRISVKSLERQGTDSPGKERSGSMRYRRRASGRASRGSFGLRMDSVFGSGDL